MSVYCDVMIKMSKMSFCLTLKHAPRNTFILMQGRRILVETHLMKSRIFLILFVEMFYFGANQKNQ